LAYPFRYEGVHNIQDLYRLNATADVTYYVAVPFIATDDGIAGELGRVLINAQMFGLEGGNVPLGHSITGFEPKRTLVCFKILCSIRPVVLQESSLDGYTAAF
jgi:hypothetical protein